MKKLALAALAAFLPSSAVAQEGLDLSVTGTLVSDYRYRGISLSGRDPAVQGSVDLSVAGFYAGVWASSIARFADTNVEADVYAGYSGEAGGIGFDIGAIGYLYPGGDGTGDVYEATGSIAYTIGPARLKLAAAYAPDQKNLAGDNLYLSADAEIGIPGTPLTATAQFGRERGSFYGRKLDWSLGAEFSKAPFTVGIAWFDTDLDSSLGGFGRNAGSGVVARVGATF